MKMNWIELIWIDERSQQLKTVMENCGERIPAGSRNDSYGRSAPPSSSGGGSSGGGSSGGGSSGGGGGGDAPPSSYLPPPPFDCHSLNIDDKEYAIPSVNSITINFNSITIKFNSITINFHSITILIKNSILTYFKFYSISSWFEFNSS